MNKELVKYKQDKQIDFLNQARELIAKADIPLAKEIENRAEAIRTYLKKIGANLKIQNQAAEVKIRAQRKTGELLEKEIKQGGNPKSHDVTLKDLGIEKMQSSRYQLISGLPVKIFEDYISIKQKELELTTIGVLRLAKELEREKRREELEEQGKNYVGEDDDVKMILGDFREITKEISDNSIDLILTDPPYPREYLNLWQDLFIIAERILKPSGFLVAYSGQTYLDEIFKMKNNLIYFWTSALLFTKKPFIAGRNVQNGWKPILIFQKEPFEKTKSSIVDLIKNEYTEREFHDKNWGQTVQPFEKLLDTFSKPGEMILDPFAGSGTTLIACKIKGRKAKGIEIEEKYVKIANGRLKELDKLFKKENI